MKEKRQAPTYDFVVIGSGFGGSVSAMRLAEKSYQVLVLERGKRYRDNDFARSNWIIWKYLWVPVLRCFGILEMSFLNGVMVFRGSGVGGGSLCYANVLMEPDDQLFEAAAWRDLTKWKTVLRPHYDTARRMLGVATNPRLWTADAILEQIAVELGYGETFRPIPVGVFFGNPDQEVSDPYFDGAGPSRRGCTHCGGCMVGCRYNAKNTLVKNYLYFAEKLGAEVWAECEVYDIRPLPAGQADGARYEVIYRCSTAFIPGPKSVRTRNVILSAGVLGTVGLLYRCRDVTGSLPKISHQLGEKVRTNSEALMGVIGRDSDTDYSQGIAVSSVFNADPVTVVEPVRHPDGSSFMRLLAAPLIRAGNNRLLRIAKSLAALARHPFDTLHVYIRSHWARRTTILLVMQTIDNSIHLHLGRNLFTLFRRRLVSLPENDQAHVVHAQVELAYKITRTFASKSGGIPACPLPESLLNLPITAHILGGCPLGRSDQDGVADIHCEVFNYPGLYVVDGSIVPANPGVNPSLTIAALAEYAMSHIPPAAARQNNRVE